MVRLNIFYFIIGEQPLNYIISTPLDGSSMAQSHYIITSNNSFAHYTISLANDLSLNYCLQIAIRNNPSSVVQMASHLINGFTLQWSHSAEGVEVSYTMAGSQLHEEVMLLSTTRGNVTYARPTQLFIAG